MTFCDSDAAQRIDELLCDGPYGFTKAHDEEINSLFLHLDLEKEIYIIEKTRDVIQDWYRTGVLDFVPEEY